MNKITNITYSALINNSEVSHSLSIRTTSGVQRIYLKPGQIVNLSSMEAVIDSNSENYFSKLKAIGIIYNPGQYDPQTSSKLVDSKQNDLVDTNSSELVNDLNDPSTTDLPDNRNSELPPEPTSDADKDVMIGYLDSTYKKYELESICQEAGVDFEGTKYEIIENIVNQNPKYVLSLMN